ncbi:hypothetical protein SteCoe_31979 [Stentor coeruleus]|uniref:Uncharacterized protein n=1 Tax=Stentor coeruleus TaxID=5963 RepID=A0A1R2B087_9CILI|nr:hypothetical protein SteCoe_31979 [Stentor coeruleus]
MEIWKDYQNGQYYTIDPTKGTQSPSNRFGQEKKIISPHEIRYFNKINPRVFPVDKNLAIQPKKFDGYCQFPRPYEKSSIIMPYTRTQSKSPKYNRICDQSKIPHPLEFLSISDFKNKNRVSPILKISKSSSYRENKFESFKDFKKPKDCTITEVKTVEHISIRKNIESEILKKRWKTNKPKEIRRKIKGVFLTKFKTSSELMKIENSIREKTNPALIEKRAKFEEFETKMLERKRKATSLLKIASNY